MTETRTPRPVPTPEALRAMSEALARRDAAKPLKMAKELEGRGGPEPVRYGDYEKNGIAIDF